MKRVPFAVRPDDRGRVRFTGTHILSAAASSTEPQRRERSSGASSMSYRTPARNTIEGVLKLRPAQRLHEL